MIETLRRNARTIFLLVLTGIVAVIWYATVWAESRQNLLITFFDVGQGDSILIEAPNGNQVLIDGGPSDVVLAKLGRALPFWDRSLDLVILTHPHADHLDGLVGVAKRYGITAVIESGVNHSIPEYEEWRRLLQEKGVRVVTARAGQRVQLSEHSYLDILTPFDNFEGKSPPDIHDAMVVAKLTHGSTTTLFMGDAEKSIEYRLLYSGTNVDSDILKVGHHGSKTSTSEDFLAAVSPRIAIISAGRKNRYGHPHQEIVDLLTRSGISIFRTDRDRDVVMESDGKELRIVR